MANRNLRCSFSTEGITAHEVVRFHTRQELGRPAQAHVVVEFLGPVEAHELLGYAARFTFGYADSLHTFLGIVDEVTLMAASNQGSRASHKVLVSITSEMGLLEHSFGSRIHQELDVQEIVTKVLDEHGISADRQQWQLTGNYPKREYCVQWQESALAFVSRLLEEEGIFYFSREGDDGKEQIVFHDSSPDLSPIEGEALLPFRGRSGLEAAEDAIIALSEEELIRSGEMVLRDYDFKRPSLDLTKTATADEDTDLSVYDYPGQYVEPDVGDSRARVRLEAERVRRQTVTATAVCPRLVAGATVDVGEATRREEVEATYAIIAIEHELGLDDDDAAEGDTTAGRKEIITGRATLLPVETPFRTAQQTPTPVIAGSHTARVVAPEGAEAEEIHTDEHGRCKVKFHWDLDPPEDDKASCWMRVAQLQTSGSMVLPRVGWEVVVEFLEGHPDRPVVTGMLYNGRYMPPYSLPMGRTRTSLMSRSTPGGSGSNEIRFEDLAGGEEIMIHAQYDFNTTVAENKTKNIGNNETKVVGVDASSSVSGNETSKITKGDRTTVGGDQSVSVGGNRNVEVNAVTGVTAGANSTTTVGGNHFEMDGNPLQALLALAAQKVTELATAKAAEVMAQVDAAVQSRVDQAMAPINELQSSAQSLQAGMQALTGGDLGPAGGVLASAANLPIPPAFGGPAATQAPGGGSSAAGITAQTGLDQAVNGAIQQGIQNGANALASAMGLDPVGGGGSSTDNVDGPEGDVPGIDGADREKGPGHSLNNVAVNHTEVAGGMRIQAALTGVMTNVGAMQTENVGAVKATMALGNIASSVEGVKNETALGLVVVSRADESETVGAAKTTMVGGAIAEKIGGGHSIEAGGMATFIGAFHKVEAQGKITFKCGASEVVVDGGGISITSPMVMITAGKIQLTKNTSEV